MTFGLSLGTFTLLHVIISLIAIISGFVVMWDLWLSRAPSALTKTFLATTILTSVTGFFFPFTKLLPSHIVGMISLVFLALALFSLYAQKLHGIWRVVYPIVAILALYLNVFVLIVQAFLKVGALKALAPTQSEPPFLAVQGSTLLFFVAAIIFALIKFHPTEPKAIG